VVRWLDPTDNPFGIKILDCQPITRGMVSTTADPRIADSFVSLRSYDGAELRPQDLIPCCQPDRRLVYPHTGSQPTGPVFKADQMEVKWDVYCLGGSLLFCRSWTGDLIYVAEADWTQDAFRVTRIHAASGSQIDAQFAERAVDYLLKSHVYSLAVPHPLRPADPEDTQTLAAMSFSEFGNRAWFGTFEDPCDLKVVRDALWGSNVPGEAI